MTVAYFTRIIQLVLTSSRKLHTYIVIDVPHGSQRVNDVPI